MFTGIVLEIGELADIQHKGESVRLRIAAPLISQEAALGDSICVNGVCLTVSELGNGFFSADLSSETVQRTTFKDARKGDSLNLEPALRPSDRLGGHIVSGHVDGIGLISEIIADGEFCRLAIRFPEDLAGFIAFKGSLCVNGISLTISSLDDDIAQFAIIPFTIQQTNLRGKNVGDPVNLEVDILARYVQRLLSVGSVPHSSGLTIEKLRQYGFAGE